MKSCGIYEAINEDHDNGLVNTYPPRWGHTVTIINDIAFIYGGYSSNTYYGDIWEMDLKDNFTIKKIEMTYWNYCNLLQARSLHSTIAYESSLIIYGGMLRHNEVHELDLGNIFYQPIKYDTITYTWSILPTLNPLNYFRSGHSASLIYNDYMFIFGGEDCNSTTQSTTAVFPIILNLKTMKWTKVKIDHCNSDILTNRSHHSACVMHNNQSDLVYIYGGHTGNEKCLNNLIIFDFDKETFETNTIKANIKIISFDQYTQFPFPRWGCSLNNINSTELLLFGGRNKVDFNDLWVFDIKEEKWTQIISIGEAPEPRRKHISFIYKNILMISGGYNGYFLNNCFILNLATIDSLHIKEDEIKHFINNPFQSDITLINSASTFNCHKMLLYSHIPEEDLITSDVLKYIELKDIPSDSKRSLDLTEVKCSDDVILKFIELLYLGHFSTYIKGKDILGIMKLLIFFHLTKFIQILYQKIIVNNIVYDSSKFIDLTMLEIIEKVIPQKDIMNITYDPYTILLKRNTISFKSSAPKIYANMIYYRFDKLVMRKKIKYYFDCYIIDQSLPLLTDNINEVCFLLELLFYADFFSYHSFYNQLERAIIMILNNYHTLSKKFLLIMIVFSFFTNGRILNHFLIGKVFKDYSISFHKIRLLLSRLLVDKRDLAEIIGTIRLQYRKNRCFVSIVNHQNISDFALVYQSDTFTEKKIVRKMMQRLQKAKINFKIPQLNMINNKLSNNGIKVSK